ncbi:MAG: MFS transporter [Bacteroidales bacterium]|nr:MFS transporter [Bacteroidales bacterium]
MNRFLDIRPYFNRMGFAFRALESRNFRLFFYSGMASLIGTWIQNLALGWLVYRLTDSAFYLGLVGFAGQIPALFLSPIAGVYADRVNRRKMLIITQTIPMLLAFLLAGLVYTDQIHIGLLMVIVVINGVAISFDTPFRHAFLLEMIGDRKLLTNAVALNSTLVNTARFIGPTIGGFLIAFAGEAFCFLVNGISFTGVIIALMSMRVAKTKLVKPGGTILMQLREGVLYTYRFKPVRYMILLVITTSVFGLPFQAFLPVFARDVLAGNSQMLGLLTGAIGAGALTGAFYLATRRSLFGLPQLIRFTAFLFALGLMAFSLSEYPWLSLSLLYFTGFGMIVQFAATNTLLQTVVEEDKRGRVLSFYSMSFMGFTPLGSLLLGVLAEKITVPYTILLSALMCLGAAFLFSRKTSFIRKELKLIQ